MTKVIVYQQINHALTTEADVAIPTPWGPEDVDPIVEAAMETSEDGASVTLCHQCADAVGDSYLEGGDPIAVTIGDDHYVQRNGKWVKE